MSRRDPRFKPLAWHLTNTNPNAVYQAAGVGTVYHIVTIDDAHQVLGCNDPEKNEQYYILADAKTVCQLDHEARLKEWLN
jgi:hypothetical protein